MICLTHNTVKKICKENAWEKTANVPAAAPQPFGGVDDGQSGADRLNATRVLKHDQIKPMRRR